MRRSDKREQELDSRIDLFRKRLKDSDDLKVKDDVFDTRTLMNLYYLAKKGYLQALGGPVSTGKEANIFSALGKGGDLVALKIYRVATTEFRSMQDYLRGDPRFGNTKGDRRSLINAWTRKEYRNLLRAEEAGIRVPHPFVVRENIIVLEFIGQEDQPAPLLRDVQLDSEEARRAFEWLADAIATLYRRAALVHADLSEFNVLYPGHPVIIDMAQSVTLDHPMARSFLRRDVSNLVRFFQSRYGIGSIEEVMARLKPQAKDEEAPANGQG
ncbi:MAG: RIO-type serine/threonine-protein kinase Rio1 [Methanosaeta sp. PtaB.Bin039]|nr:MAG: RIO-type serine/threonine-protein kinase Rio1 [Methanosaeta sp. PtaB.Bin039]OPY47792.1 MAG: RIO-type serine/threonine-protein kinase Rio1 [Methanosaeta sp. PtaU1.Bin028]HQF16924.1 serine protein kinase RIO [Methanotrichaceae archaeon]HQI91491.1 serine protein kinase RIO [Methanotrichaceae archaeon]HQJ28829.1 serine protein kinase RIO [Methanotrichaceae archaeon]